MRPILVFVSGWGQSSQVWHNQSAYFSKDWPVQGVNLPGHGGVPDAPAECWLNELSVALPNQPCILIGWSLGGMLAMQLAHRWRGKLAGLVLVSSTPCFRVKPDWEPGCSGEQFHAFEQALERDPDKLLGQFFTLMLHGDTVSRGRFNAIAKEAVDRKHPPLTEALRSGLKLLDTLDLRAQLVDISIPTLVVHGTHDQVAPVEAGRYLAGHIPGARLHIMACGHAPHLTQDKTFNAYLEQWCLNSI